MAIKLTTLQSPQTISEAVDQGYLYSDISFDLQLPIVNGNELYKTNNKKDLLKIFDTQSVLNSLKNVLTTSPGEKLLNPTFGLDLRDYLFETVTESKGYFLGQKILRGLETQEPRVTIERIDVEVNAEEQQYNINLEISIPSLNAYGVSLRGVLNNDGYTFVQ
jgi:phage baseplate assembly protein W